MSTSKLFQKIQDCCGCELCSVVCPRHIIEMREDDEGFLYPHVIDDSACISCNRCLSVCPAKSPGREPNSLRSSYGGYVNDLKAVKSSSSGGFATAISQSFVEKGGVVYGVGYSTDYLSITYDRAERIDELERFRTSKYAQAHKDGVYAGVDKDLKEDRKVLFIGLPCEVSALYHYVRAQENLYTISLICHGPTSQNVHRQFCEGILKDNDAEHLDFLSLRHKETGWKPYFIKARFNTGAEYMREFNKTGYDVAFKYLKRPSCSVCKYKLGNKEFGLVADLVLGDYHGVRKDSPEFNGWGVSQASVLTDKGEELIAMLQGSSTLHPISRKIIESTNIALRASIPLKRYRKQFASAFCKKGLSSASRQPLVRLEMKKNELKRDVKHLLIKVRNRLLHA